MPLTPRQLNAVRSLDWLLDSSDQQRQTGRSFTLAIALIRQALRYPGRDIYYTDHVPQIPHRDQIRLSHDIVQDLTERDPFLRLVGWTFRQRSFLAVLPEETIVASASIPFPIDDWWPHESVLESTLANLAEAGEVATRLQGHTPIAEVLEQERELDAQLAKVQYVPDVPRPSAWERLGREDGDALTGLGTDG